jgi:hypothetical protein
MEPVEARERALMRLGAVWRPPLLLDVRACTVLYLPSSTHIADCTPPTNTSALPDSYDLSQAAAPCSPHLVISQFYLADPALAALLCQCAGVAVRARAAGRPAHHVHCRLVLVADDMLLHGWFLAQPSNDRNASKPITSCRCKVSSTSLYRGCDLAADPG